ncbi:MAG TPA: glucosamine-6-phosphate deaminase [Candidatus Latescibacteria bacterium]|jgi:glucosamine-6-phosphate deaminase|nr:glucosamine-6-phosphate deaminase [Gemmatimonadaceae bacterium]MDP6014947.1 glucosamine-6-phosphate deaminase [Candidatus Latescibacterota bacterium]HJP33223.1 glucosamine-6-phosphate deaminase [Candidatus Latescibacterota bacterium]|tara:strand:- start:2264 stop:3016 length:753 start_codon:yes stop_codon:yes gene_type:complete
MAGNIKLQICDNAADVAIQAAAAFAELVRAQPDAVIGLATGSTPEASYAEMARLHRDSGLSFADVTSFNLDEYWGLGGDHDQSYRHFMNDRLFQHIDINPWNTHVLNGKARFPELECRSFEDRILAVGGIDLWLLGIGGNGHIAFNEPGSPVDSRTRLVSLTQETIESNSDGRFFSDASEVPRCALSAGIGTIRESSSLILLATGEKKADAIAAAVEGPFSVDCPASLLQDHADCTFIIDAGAASKLTSK